MNSTIKVENINKSFRRTKVLNSVNVELTNGKIYGIIGHNGSGKTVLLKIICGLMEADTGKILFDGKQRKHIDRDTCHIGAIIENPGFLTSQSGLKNLLYLASIRNRITKDKVIETMEKVGLNPHEKKRVAYYSLGMKQRLGFAQAIMENPDILVLDKPMNGLDVNGVADMRKYLLELKEQGKTIILASHSVEDIRVLCDTVYEIHDGALTKVTMNEMG